MHWTIIIFVCVWIIDIGIEMAALLAFRLLWSQLWVMEDAVTAYYGSITELDGLT